MLFTYNNTTQTVAQNGAVNYLVNSVQTGCTATHTPNTAQISLNKCGIYAVFINADVANTTATAGDVKLQLYGNGVALDGLSGTNTTTSTTDIENIAFSGLVKVAPDTCSNTSNVPYYLTVVNTGIEATISNAAITVKKVQ